MIAEERRLFVYDRRMRYSGDEADVYGEGDEYYESHCGYYDIRDICRIDPDIVPFLNLPYGTEQMRGKDGKWYETIDNNGKEESHQIQSFSVH